MQNATKRGYSRRLRTRATTRDPAWTGPPPHVNVREGGRRFESVRELQRLTANLVPPLKPPSCLVGEVRIWGQILGTDLRTGVPGAPIIGRLVPEERSDS